MSTQKIILGTISGVLAGVAVGLLVAPMSGEETRQKISDSADEFATGVKDKVSQLTKKGAMKADDLKAAFNDKIEGISDDVREKIVKLLDSSKDAADNVKEVANNAKGAADNAEQKVNDMSAPKPVK